ncbi:unnamed protein product [Urochloa decumbens]|uniref:DUF1618 domain-containing protein n=1 Tax=Urochloa decumbens TaxID=240449 RepID=A0ABC8Z292_9POAL
MAMEDRRWGNNGCAEEKPTHPSLRPPPHGYPPHEASPTSWILLDLHAYIADRENATSAWSKTSSGKAIRVTFCTAPPPLVSYICVWCPDAEIFAEPTVEASGSDLVLLCVSLRGSPHHAVDYFVYKATGGKGPSLRLLQDPDPCLSDRYNVALLAHRDVGTAEGDDHYYIAALNRDKGSRLQDFRLWIFDSQDGKWTSRPFSLDSIYCHITCKVITLGEGGLLGFVDPWRGIVVCDVLGRRPERFLPLPPELIRLDKFRDEPLLSRDIAFVRGRLSVVELCGIIIQGIDSNYWSWKVSSWSMKVTRRWEEDWQTDYMIQRHEISVDTNTVNVNLLPNAHENEGTYQPTLKKLYMAHPTLSLSDDHVIYLMGKVTLRAKKALVFSVDMRTRRVQIAALFDAERMHGCTYVQSRISNYFDATPGVKGNTKRLGKFHMGYPRKLQDLDRMCVMHAHDRERLELSGDVEQQDTGISQEAEDEDNTMALD